MESAVTPVRDYESADEQRVLQIFKAGLMQYAVEGSIVKHMEESFFASKTAPDGDMYCIKKFYSDHPDRNFFVAVCAGEVCGICGAVVSEDGQSVELQRMSVAAESRGQGAGEQLVQAVIAFAAARAVAKVKLGTLDRKVGAIRLYERHGFRRVNTIRLSKQMFVENFGVSSDEVVNVIEFELQIGEQGAT